MADSALGVLKTLFGDDAEILEERDFQALLLANIIGPLSTTLLSPILESLIEPLGTSPANIGLLISFMTAPAIVMIPVAGLIAGRYGRKPVLVVALVVFGLAGAAIAFTTDFRIALALRAVQGVAFGGLVPIIITSIGDLYDGSTETTAQGIRFTGSGLTQTVFPLLSSVLVVIAWQYPFLLYAISLPIAAIVYVEFDEPIDVDATGGADTNSTKAQLGALAGLLRQRRVFPIVIGRGLPVVIWIGFLTYNSIIVVRVIGGNPTHAGMLAAVGSVAFAFASSQAGRLTATFDSPVHPLLAGHLALGIGFALFVLAPSIAFAGLGIAVAGVGFGLTGALYRSIITGLTGDTLRSGLVSMAEAFGRVCATMTPIFMGGVIAVASPQLGTSSALQIAGLVAAVIGGGGGVLCIFVATRSAPIRTVG